MTRRFTRREAMFTAASAGLGALGAFGQTRVGNPPYPSWKTGFRQLAPNVYAYTQAGGPGVPSSAISNGACIRIGQ